MTLVDRLKHTAPSYLIQSYCAAVRRKVAYPLLGKVSLSQKWRACLQFTVSAIRTKAYSPKPEASPESLAQRVYCHARALDTFIEDMPNASKHRAAVLRMVAKKSDFVIRKKSESELSVHETIALRDYMKGSTNSLYHLQQGMKVFFPSVRFLPANTRQKIHEVKHEGTVSPRILALSNYAITKKGKQKRHTPLLLLVSTLCPACSDASPSGHRWRSLQEFPVLVTDKQTL